MFPEVDSTWKVCKNQLSENKFYGVKIYLQSKHLIHIVIYTISCCTSLHFLLRHIFYDKGNSVLYYVSLGNVFICYIL